jgi:hypothetical protein
VPHDRHVIIHSIGPDEGGAGGGMGKRILERGPSVSAMRDSVPRTAAARDRACCNGVRGDAAPRHAVPPDVTAADVAAAPAVSVTGSARGNASGAWQRGQQIASSS